MIILSLVVPVYCVEPWIEKCLRSIVAQPVFVESCELVIVDDGSPDRSIEIANQVCDGLPNIRLIRQTNHGLGSARNTGAAAVHGKYLWFVDSDDWLTDDGLARVVNLLKHSEDLDVVNIDYLMSNGHRSTVINHAHPERVYAGVDYLACSYVQNPVQYYIWSTAFYRKQALEFERGLYHEDALFTPTALYLAKSVRRLALDCYVYNLREGSIMNSGNYLKHALDMVIIVDRLESFRATRVSNARGSTVLANYSALAIGGIYYYWKLLDVSEKAQLTKGLRFWNLLRPVFRSHQFKYILAITRMSLAPSRAIRSLN